MRMKVYVRNGGIERDPWGWRVWEGSRAVRLDWSGFAILEMGIESVSWDRVRGTLAR